MVTFVFSCTAFSQSPSPHQWHSANPPGPANSCVNASQLSMTCVLSRRRCTARSNRSCWMRASSFVTASASCWKPTASFFRSWRATIITCWPARSRGPSSMRRGTPLRSHSAYFQPGRMLSRLSTWTLPTVARSCAASPSAAAQTCAISSSFFQIGTMTALVPAMRGGRTRPSSSLCVMMRAPMMRVLMPQLVAQTCSTLPSESWYLTSKALAKFCPRSWLVAACRALPSCIIASIENVSTAPAKRSLAVLTPLITGMARISSANQR